MILENLSDTYVQSFLLPLCTFNRFSYWPAEDGWRFL